MPSQVPHSLEQLVGLDFSAVLNNYEIILAVLPDRAVLVRAALVDEEQALAQVPDGGAAGTDHLPAPLEGGGVVAGRDADETGRTEGEPVGGRERREARGRGREPEPGAERGEPGVGHLFPLASPTASGP